MVSKKWRAKLEEAIADERVVRVERRPKFAYRIEGFVVRVGAGWVLMAQTVDGGYFSGYIAFRLRDVRQVEGDTTIATAFAKTQPEWPPSYPHALDLDTVDALLHGLGQGGKLIGIEKSRQVSATWIGRLDEVTRRFVYLHEVRPDGTWHDEPLGYKLKAITAVEVDTRYIIALETIASADGDAVEFRHS